MFDDLPVPAAVAARPRDHRGYPVPAITPWAAGEPRFALTGVARSFVCAVERRCSICATEMPDGPVWRVIGGTEADAIRATVAAGHRYRNQAPSVEAPGHRSCMLFAAAVCPYLARPNARRGQPALAPGLAADRGEKRGSGGALVGFETYEFSYADDEVRFRFAGLCEFLPYELGGELLPALAAVVSDETGPLNPVPDYLLADEAAAQAVFTVYLRTHLG